MRELILGPGEILFNRNDLDTKLFYIYKGQMEIFIPKNEQYGGDLIYSEISEGSFFGQSGFFVSKKRDASARSKGIVHLIYCT